MLSFIKSSLKYFIVGVLALIPVVIVLQVLVFLETILREFFIYIYTDIPTTSLLLFWHSRFLLLQSPIPVTASQYPKNYGCCISWNYLLTGYP